MIMIEHISQKYPGLSWELVSRRSMRSIFRLVRQGAPEFYVKIYDTRNLWEKLRSRLNSRTQHEAFMLMSLRQSGIPVPEVQEHIRLDDASALITRAIYPATPLHEAGRGRQIEVMLEMSLSLINHGYHFTDMHAGNIILDAGGSPHLVDAYEIKPCRRIIRENAASLFAQVANIYDLTDRDLDPYLRRLDAVGDIVALKERISRISRSERTARVKRLVRRSLREGSFSSVCEDENFRAFVRRGCLFSLEEVVASHQANVTGRTGLYKYQEKTQLSRVGELCVKSYKKSAPCLAPYAVRSWKGLLTLFFNGIPVAEPVALVIFRDRRSLLITRALDEPDLDRLLSDRYDSLPLPVKHSLASRLGSFIASLHQKGIFHADLKACNIKASLEREDFFLLDTDRVSQQPFVDPDRRVRNLVQVNTSIPVRVSRTSRMAFLKGYCRVTGDDPKALFRKVWDLSSGREVVYVGGTGDHIESWPARPKG